MKKKFLISLKIAVSFGLLGGLFWLMRKDAGDILAIISSADLRWLAAALVILICNMATIAFRLKIVFHGENLNLPFGEALRLNFIGYFFNNFMPTAVGGDIMKAHCAGSYTNSRMRSYASVMMDRVIGLYSFLIVAAIALIADRGRFQIASIRFIVFSFLICGIAAFVAVTNKKIADILERFFLRIKLGGLEKRLDSLYKLVHDYRNRLDIVGKSLLVSLVSQSMYFIVIYIYF
ncbi:MAG: flippase-like domain-containing protein, partial [Candidatus Omnitrophica bacterium]|nr:flippase-like domain-containing protein [Candidatus Omnitrophota bacterium]